MAGNNGLSPDPFSEIYQGWKRGSAIGNQIIAGIKIVFSLIPFFVMTCAGFWQVFLRYGSGERYLRSFFGSVVVLWAMMGFGPRVDDTGIVLFSIVYMFVFGVKYVKAWRRGGVGSDQHSYSAGESVFRPYASERVSDDVLEYIVEPGIPLVVGILVITSCPVLGLISILSSQCIFGLSVYSYFGTKKLMRDKVDQEIEAKANAQLTELRQNAQESDRVELAEVSDLTEKERALITRSIAENNPPIGELMDPPQDPSAPEMTPGDALEESQQDSESQDEAGHAPPPDSAPIQPKPPEFRLIVPPEFDQE